MTDAIVFQLDHGHQEADLTYRPWGVRTLRVRAETTAGTGVLHLRPRGVRHADADAGIIRAFADDDSDVFVITWGGGHEKGPCLQPGESFLPLEKCAKMAPGTASIIFFNVHHVGPDIPDSTTVTLEAYDPDKPQDEAVLATLAVHLRKPEALPATVARIAVGDAPWVPTAGHLPHYDSRWWPGPVTYEDTGPLPLRIEIAAGNGSNPTLDIHWNNELVARIEDLTKPTVLMPASMAFELFYFDEWHVALRAWFFWTDTTIGDGPSLGILGRHEVPDAERFDLLINRTDNRVNLACTDLHWRETWGYTLLDAPPPLRAQIGLSRAQLFKKAFEEAGKRVKNWEMWKGDAAQDHTSRYDPLPDIRRMARIWYGNKTVPVGTMRDKGSEAHVPLLLGILQTDEVPSRMTSSDVRAR